MRSAENGCARHVGLWFDCSIWKALSLSFGVHCPTLSLRDKGRAQFESSSDQLDAVAEHVLNVTALDAGNLVVFTNRNAGCAQFHDQATIIHAGERGVRFPGRPEIFFDSEMNLDVSALEPESTTGHKFRRLGDFFHPKEGALKLAGFLFMALWHGELHMV